MSILYLGFVLGFDSVRVRKRSISMMTEMHFSCNLMHLDWIFDGEIESMGKHDEKFDTKAFVSCLTISLVQLFYYG